VSTLTATVTVTDVAGHATTATASCVIEEAFVSGETKPVASNTGLNVLGLDPTDPTDGFTVVNGDLNITPALVASNGPVFDRYWVKGFVYFTAAVKCTLSNSKVQGRTFSTPGSPPRTALVYARSSSTPASAVLDIINTEAAPVQPDVAIVGFSGERIGEVRRCNVYRVSDHVNYWGSQAKVYDSYFHDFTFWENDPKHTNDGSHPGWSHNDGVQSNGCTNAIIFGNNFDMRADPLYGDSATLTATFPGGAWGSGVMLSGSNGYFVNAKIQKNWFGYGQAPVAMPLQSGGAFEDEGCSWEVTGNRFYALPDPYGSNQRQFIRWGNKKCPPGGYVVHSNVFTNDATIPTALQGTTLPAPVLVGANDASGQLMCRVNVNNP
jgi:hypothetical protein